MENQDKEHKPENSTDDVETSTVQSPEIESYNNDAKNDAKNNRLPIALFIVVIIVIVIAAIVALGRTKTVEAPVVNNTAPITEQSEKVNSPVGGELDDKLIFEPFDITNSGVDTYYEPTSRFLKIPIIEDLSYAASITQKNPESPLSVDTVRTYFYADLRDAGFEDYIDPNDTIGAFDAQEKTIGLKKGDVVCKLNVSGVENIAASVGQFCADMSLTPTVAENMEQFYEAYESSNEYTSSDYRGSYVISVNEDDIKDSEIAGYQYLYGGIGFFDNTGANLAFVRTTNAEWVFFVGRQDILGCDKYADELLHKALAHETCYKSIDDTQVLVKDFYNL